MLLHRMALVSFRLFCKNLGNLQEFFGQMVYRPPWQKIARTPMTISNKNRQKAILTGLPIFLGERVAAATQATRLVADHCLT